MKSMGEKEGRPVSEAFLGIVALAERLGVSSINKLPGCWEHKVDDDWWVAVNGHKEPRLTSVGFELGPFQAVVFRRGMPALVLRAHSGVAMWDTAEDEFLKALEKAPG